MEELRRRILLARAPSDPSGQRTHHERRTVGGHGQSGAQNADRARGLLAPSLDTLLFESELDHRSVGVGWSQWCRLGQRDGVVRPCSVDHGTRYHDDVMGTACASKFEEIGPDGTQHDERSDRFDRRQTLLQTDTDLDDRGLHRAIDESFLQSSDERLVGSRHDHYTGSRRDARHANEANST